MPTSEQILALAGQGYSDQDIATEVDIPPGLAYLIATGLLAENPTRKDHVLAWVRRRAVGVLQLLLGNVRRPGAGIQALRGHARIQGFSDIPTLFDTLPGYIPMPHAHLQEDLTEARVLVTERMTPLKAQGRTLHQIGLPFHWDPNGYTTGDAANELTSIALDPNVHIQEVEALIADIRPGRRPRGPDLPRLVAEYQRRADITERTGREI
jgi:hypothetical protein